MMELSTVPTRIEGTLAPRYVDLRPFAVNDGNEVWVLPGGLTQWRWLRFPGGQLQPRRRLQGHLGAGPARFGGRPRVGRCTDCAFAAAAAVRPNGGRVRV